MYRVVLSPTSAQILRDLHPEIRRQIKNALEKLADSPCAGKMLRDELAPLRSFRIKRSRVIYRPDDDTKFVKIYMIGHRRDIYDLLRVVTSRETVKHL